MLQATPAQVQGPYFIANAPLRSDLTVAGMTGSAFEISGQVLARDGKAIQGATVHVWLADPQGAYDNQDAQGNPIRISQAQMKLRGRIQADKQGKFAFKGLRPGNYKVGAGPDDYRPAHIHVMVEAPGYQTLITQLYFSDDKFNTKDLPGPGFFRPELIVNFTPTAPAANTTQVGTFNFVLAK